MKKAILLIVLSALSFMVTAQTGQSLDQSGRAFWLSYLDKVARPVMENLANDQLHEKMPTTLSAKTDHAESRLKAAYLEAFGRTLSGIAPWLQTEGGTAKEVELREKYRAWALKAIANAVNPAAKDYLEWHGGQQLVDASYVALALIRSPWLWTHLDEKTRQQLISSFLITRNVIPVYTNWILFSAMIETFFCKYDLSYNPITIEYAIREFTEHWYVGDGLYSDGMQFHLDYYNSIVIQPNLNTILAVLSEKSNSYVQDQSASLRISQRYAQILERLINTDGSYPAIGRSIVYRGGVFHHLAYMAYIDQLPYSLQPGQVRAGLMAVIRKTLDAPGTFNSEGWLNIGLYGNQADLAEFYITTGSGYICANIFIPLGLPPSDKFWTSPPEPWTSVKIWNGENVEADHALDNVFYH